MSSSPYMGVALGISHEYHCAWFISEPLADRSCASAVNGAR